MYICTYIYAYPHILSKQLHLSNTGDFLEFIFTTGPQSDCGTHGHHPVQPLAQGSTSYSRLLRPVITQILMCAKMEI